MKRSLLSILVASLLFGCGGDENNHSTSTTPPTVEPDLPPDQPDIGVTTYQGKLFINGKQLTGDIQCDGQNISESGYFTYAASEGNFSCEFGAVSLGEFSYQIPAQTRTGSQPAELTQNYDLKDVLGTHADNAAKLLNKIDTCPTQDTQVCLDEINSYDIQDLYESDDQAAIDEFLNPSVANEGEQPSAHVDPELQPEVTPGTSNNLTGSFVSANAEAAYEYKPSAANKPLTKSRLTDSQGNALAGVEFFSQSARGITDTNGEFEYLWGENLIFGIDTFTLGQVKGNKVNYQLTDLSDNPLVKQNLDAFVHRYGVSSGNNIEISDNVRQVFAQYPNVINELINLSLPNGAKIEGTNFTTPNEFEAQFSQGLTQIIDGQLKQTPQWSGFTTPMLRTVRASGSNYVTQSLHQIYAGVDSVHIFHDNHGWGGSGYTRAMRNFNLTNEAFPVLMPRNDNSYWLGFGEEAAWTRGSGKDQKAYIVDATTIDKNSTIVMQRPEVISKQTATFNLPTMTAGMIGSGKVVFLGNAMYTSIFSCPENYWAGADLGIDSEVQQCRYSTPHNQEAQDADTRTDNGSMQVMFGNLIDWLVPNATQESVAIATNINKGHAFRWDRKEGQIYDFFVNPSYKLGEMDVLSSGQFASLDAASTPLLLLQSYEIKTDGYDTKSVVSDINQPKLDADDVTALIEYVNNGGNIIFFDALEESNPEPIARLADAAGVSVGGANVAKTFQSLCTDSYWCHSTSGPNVPNLHTVAEYDLVVYERYSDTTKIEINDNGTVTWPGNIDMPTLEIPLYKVSIDGQEHQRYAFHMVKSEQEKQAAVAELQREFPGVPVCKDDYQYEVNCIEVREGHGIPSRGNHHRPDFTRYEMSPEVVDSMVKAANLGANIDRLLSHELYYRSKGEIGERLSQAELTSTYDNLSVWLWNDEQYEFNPNVQDELGFERAVEMLNCYTSNAHQGGNVCGQETREQLAKWSMITESGELNPSYPLNWMEKPLTRMMLGRSYWDLDISVDTTSYPGRPSQSGSAANIAIHTDNKTVIGTAGSMQSTGLWAPQLQEVTISGGVKASINVALVDDLTGRANHELSLKRPPRVQKTFQYDGSSLSFKVPYGGLIYIQPLEVDSRDVVTFNFTGVLRASWWKNGSWLNPINTDVPLAEIDSGHFIYTTPTNNVLDTDVPKFVDELNAFANHASDFYGRDQVIEQGQHRRFTYDALLANRHRFVNDVQISIGAAHSGYPVQSNSYWPTWTVVPTNPTNDWLLWHEVGHNLASAPFMMAGSTEVTNNILALYMQEQREEKPYMDRIASDLSKSPLWLDRFEGHAWSEADVGMRLAMFGQLKLWAEDHFNIDDWYSNQAEKPSIFGKDQGWNFFKLAHRKARGDSIGDQGINYCSTQSSQLSQGDLMMACTSYLTGYDLTDYFRMWNPSETKANLPNGTVDYSGGLTPSGFNAVAAMGLPKPEKSPFEYLSVK
ncbi:sugar ABC transporter substrate-binding protein [Vibrio campbellii]|uniref:SslE/AcfD family lipoprotein zinc metalloprotease n=1 Tax=Vibrio campbellii TaxID=680 RepID=UPI000A2FBF5C|nr:SslE/AcfD family lipoprotein zinc metalloprotease [Vibrio campbellii]ARR44581.1 sugar ABC transporter substrate-binding protein [Vibrio campbellii]